MIYGYARVSTDGQSVDAQVRQLTKAGCKKVFSETASGGKTDRLNCAGRSSNDAGDVLMVTRLDRLARSTRDLLNTLVTVADRKAGFRSLRDTWADTTNPHGRLMSPTARFRGWEPKAFDQRRFAALSGGFGRECQNYFARAGY
jgi:DNA invertase Pin-like site-specific DNA recombinase